VRCHAHRRGRLRSSTPPDLRRHDKGSAAEPTNSLGLWLRSVLSVRRNDAVPEDVEAKKSSSSAKFAGIFLHDRAIDRSMQGR
jgi:hypothetical protein